MSTAVLFNGLKSKLNKEFVRSLSRRGSRLVSGMIGFLDAGNRIVYGNFPAQTQGIFQVLGCPSNSSRVAVEYGWIEGGTQI